MKSNVVFGVIASLVAGPSAALLAYGWIDLIRVYGPARAVEIAFIGWLPITQQVVLLTLAIVFGVGRAQLFTTKK
jgi:hypothetical protein